MSRLAVLTFVALVVVLRLAGVASADTSVTARLHPLNGSGAGGTVRLTATDDGRLIVVIHSHGLVPGQPHAQHIHGSLEGGGHFMCPSLKDDKNGDGILTNEEAMGEYGTIFFSLTTRGDTSARSALALDRMPVADSKGRIDYRRTFSAKRVPDALLTHLSSLHVVQHGIDVNHNGRYDMAALGESTFAKNLGFPGVPEEATDPASCGLVTGAAATTAPRGGVETGGGTTDRRDPGLVVVGGSMVGASALLVLARLRSRRARPGL